MKQVPYLLFVFMLLATAGTQAQSVGIGTTTPAPSAQLDVSSTTKGFLPPRMTPAERNAIVMPAAGLLIYCISCGEKGEWQIYNGTSWTNMIGQPAKVGIGESYQGGKVAYILQLGDPGYIVGQTHGFIAAASDQSTGAEWGAYGNAISGADGFALGTGYNNTIQIMNEDPDPGIAARICGDLVLNGYNDWFLPSVDELNKLYINRVAIGGFEPNGRYWSSSEYQGNNDIWWAYLQNFCCGSFYNEDKYELARVRAVRSF